MAKPSEEHKEAQAANAAKRAALKSAARKEGRGDAQVALFLIKEPHFDSKAVYHPAGSVVKMPMSEEPSITWEPIVARSANGEYIPASGMSPDDGDADAEQVARAGGAPPPKLVTGVNAPEKPVEPKPKPVRPSDKPVA